MTPKEELDNLIALLEKYNECEPGTEEEAQAWKAYIEALEKYHEPLNKKP